MLSPRMPFAGNHGEPEKLRSSVRRTWQKINAYVKRCYVILSVA